MSHDKPRRAGFARSDVPARHPLPIACYRHSAIVSASLPLCLSRLRRYVC